MLVTELTSTRWQRALRQVPTTVVRRSDEDRLDDEDRQLWRALSTSSKATYLVQLCCGPDGVYITCDCPAGQLAQPCRHAAAVLCATGHARWWTEIVGYRNSTGRPVVELSDGHSHEVLIDWREGIEWGGGAQPLGGGYGGRFWLARALVRAGGFDAGREDAAVLALKERIATWPVLGWRVNAYQLGQWCREAERNAKVPA